MREIKFRVWDKEKNKFVTQKPENCVEADISIDFETNYLTRWHMFELLQFTGLHDKNGKEIYEGDIVKVDHKDSRYEVGNYVIEWDDDEVSWSVGCGSPSEVNWSHEVIGNIYENPELIK